MSLLDSLLLDAFPFDFWVAIGTDGINGSGTLNDPYDNSSLAVDCFNNANPSGTLIRGFNGNTQRYSDELATNIEDTLCISI
jgi:hypothetical protein